MRPVCRRFYHLRPIAVGRQRTFRLGFLAIGECEPLMKPAIQRARMAAFHPEAIIELEWI
jgi:hypothetical protein